MDTPLTKEQLDMLEKIVFSLNPQTLHHPDLRFFKEYIESFGGRIPPVAKAKENMAGDEGEVPQADQNLDDSEEESESESEVDLDMEGVIEPDKLEDNQTMGDPNKIPTDEDRDASDEKRATAMSLFNDQNYAESVKLYTEAIELNPSSALLFAKRGQVNLKLSKPNACIRDCNKALELNCDSAAAYKFRGRANRLLGNWEEAAKDLRESCKIDFDEQANEWLAEVTPNADKIRAHKLNLQRRKEEKEHRERLNKVKKAQAARASAAKQQSEQVPSDDSDFPGGLPGFNKDYSSVFMDPEIMAAMQDPELAAAFESISANPANIMKYANNPKVAAVIQKLQSKLGGKVPGGMPGGMPGGPPGFPSFGGAGGGASAPKPPRPDSDDVGLD